MRVPAIAMLALAWLWLTGAPGVAAETPFEYMRVRSETRSTEIRLAVTGAPKLEDRSRRQTGAVVTDEIRLFFPETTLPRSRLVTVGDEVVEEVRLYPAEGGVLMTIIVRRPVTYEVEQKEGSIFLRLRPGVLLAEGAEAPSADTARKARRAPRREPRPGIALGSLSGMKIEPGEGLSIDAAEISYDQETNEAIAEGGVTIALADSLLSADVVRINRETQEAVATGNVRLSDPQGTLRSERFMLNLEDETGVIEDASLFLTANNLTVTGELFEKSYGQTYSIQDGSFTTCQCGVGPPSWSIAGEEIDITLEGYGIARNATFRVNDVPILYLPEVAFPAKVSRQSGLLAPQIGFSQNRGATWLQPGYLVLSKSADATLSVDIETAARVGAVAEGRYALDPESGGTFNVAYFNELLRSDAEDDIVNRNIADPDIPDNRWSITARAEQTLPLGARGFVDALVVSDDLYLREIPTFSFDPEYERTRRTSRFSRSRVGFYRAWEPVSLIGQAIYYQDFIQEDDLTLQRLPQLSLFGSERFFDRRLKLRFSSELVNFARTAGFDGPRFDLFPEAEVPFRWQEYLRGKLTVGLRETAYHLTETSRSLPVTGAGAVQQDLGEFDTNPTRELFTAGVSVETQVYRIFDVGGEHVEKLKHTIEPSVSFAYIPDVNQDDLPTYDFVDRVDPRSLFTYGVATRLLAKTRRPVRQVARLTPGELNSFSGVAPSPFDDERTRSTFGGFGSPDPDGETTVGLGGSEPEDGLPGKESARRAAAYAAESNVTEWGRLSIQQSYDVKESLQTDREDHFSDIDLSLQLTPDPSFQFYLASSLDPESAEISSNSIGFYLRDPRARRPGRLFQSGQRAAVGISYRFIQNDILEEIDGSLFLPVADSLSAFYQGRYDALATEFLENRFGFRLTSQCQCWIFDLFVTDRVNPNEMEVRSQITLVGLGSIGRNR